MKSLVERFIGMMEMFVFSEEEVDVGKIINSNLLIEIGKILK